MTPGQRAARQPPIADYGLIGDSRGAALVSREGSIDWCCVPRFDSGACFARLLDAERGGHCSVSVRGEKVEVAGRDYVRDSLVLETTFRAPGTEATLRDCFTAPDLDGEHQRSEIARVLEVGRGTIDVAVRVEPRFDYGAVDAWIRRHGKNLFSAIGGDDGLIIWSDLELEIDGRHALAGEGPVHSGERLRLVLVCCRPAEIDEAIESMQIEPEAVDGRVDQTIASWKGWAGQLRPRGPNPDEALRSALVLCALTYKETGAIVAAPTTSLPEVLGGERNWDYRFSWIRDSALAVRSLAELGYEEEAAALRRFVERSAAGNAKDLQVMFGIAGEHRIGEERLEHLSGYAGSEPVRIGNQAKDQLQLDALGQLVEQSWRWYERGHEPDDDYWRFLVDLVEAAIEHWSDPDAGIWEWPGEPKHFVHSKVMCWAAVDRGLRLAKACMRRAPERRWRRAREEIRAAVESDGYDSDRGVFVQAFGETSLDAALLRLPIVDFVAYDDERMIRTTDAIREALDWDGVLRRYDSDDGLAGTEGAFVACGFWLAEVLARQGRVLEARAAYDRSMGTANELGLFSEEYDPDAKVMLGNFPQALSHLSHLEAAIALADAPDPEA